MIKTTAQTIRRGTLVIAGGWELETPAALDLVPDGVVHRAYTQHYIENGFHPVTARQAANTAIQGRLDSAWSSALADFLAHWAAFYMRTYPWTVSKSPGGKFRSPQGFKPEELQYYYVPGRNTGRHGAPEIRELMRQWADEVKP